MEKNYFSEFRNARRFRALNRAVEIILGLTLIFALNFLASKYFHRIDLSKTGTYTLAPESKGYLRALKEPIEIIVMIPMESNDPNLETILHDLQRLLREYVAEGTQDGQAMVKVEFVDIYKQRKRTIELKNQFNLTQDNIILVTNGSRSQQVQLSELYTEDDGLRRGFSGERAITSAVVNIATADEDKIYFLVGHGEMRLDDVDPLRGLSQLESFLRERNYVLATLDLAIEESIPEDADLIVVPSPQASLLPVEVERLRRYMTERNGRMIILIDPGRRHGMEDLLYDWGVLADDMAVIDQGPDFRSQGGDLIIRRFAEHPITNILVDYQITALFGQPRPVRTDPASLNDERLRVTQIVGTSEQSWGERDYRSQDPGAFDPKRDIEGPVSIATVSTRSAGSELGISIPGGRMVVFGNSDFIANNRLRAIGNRTLFFNSLNWALTKDSLLNIATRPLESYQIVMSERDLYRALGYFSILPAGAAALGLLIFLIRRR
jgi:hypothetical protein